MTSLEFLMNKEAISWQPISSKIDDSVQWLGDRVITPNNSMAVGGALFGATGGLAGYGMGSNMEQIRESALYDGYALPGFDSITSGKAALMGALALGLLGGTMGRAFGQDNNGRTIRNVVVDSF